MKFITICLFLWIALFTFLFWQNGGTLRVAHAQSSDAVYVFEAHGCKQVGQAGRCDPITFAGKFTVAAGVLPAYWTGYPEQKTSGFVSCTDCIVTPNQPSRAFGGVWRALPTGEFFFTVQMSTGEAQFVVFLAQESNGEAYGRIRQIFPTNYQVSGDLVKQ